MSFKWIYCLILLILFSSVEALVEEQINEKKPISIHFSITSHNRISVERGGVEKIFGDESSFNIAIDRATGNAFVNLTRPILEPLTLTVVTRSGLIQDLSITSGEKPSEHLILKEVDEDRMETSSISSNAHKPTVDFLNRILEGKIPIGYGERPLEEDDVLKLPHPLSASAITAFEGPFEHIVVYKIKNRGKGSIVMNADTIKTAQTSWVFLSSNELNAKKALLCIIAISKSE